MLTLIKNQPQPVVEQQDNPAVSAENQATEEKEEETIETNQEGNSRDKEMASSPPIESESNKPSTYGPVRRRIGNKSGPLSLWRPAEMASDDFADIMREVVPRLINDAVSGAMDDSQSSSSTGVKRSASPTAQLSESEPATSRQRIEETTEVLSVQVVSELWDEWAESENPIEQLIANYLQKKTTNELHHSHNGPVLQEMIEDSKMVEWGTLIDKNAVKVHYGSKARKIKEQHQDRFIGSKMVITRKPLEEGTHYMILKTPKRLGLRVDGVCRGISILI